MSNPIKEQKFNPFYVELDAGQRLRLKDGVLTVEDSTVRSSASAWTRFWTRGQYSQSTILKKMCKIYEDSQAGVDNDKKRNNFVKNFATLEGRATAQNELFKDTNSIVRFFEAKSFIDVASFHDKFQKVDDAVVQAAEKKLQAAEKKLQDKVKAAEKKIQNEAKAAQKKLDERIAAQEKMAQDNLRKAEAEATKQAQEEQRIAKRDAETKPIRDTIAMLKKQIEELENCPIDVFLVNEFDRLVNKEKLNPEATTLALKKHGKLQYNCQLASLRNKLSSAEKTLEELK